MAYKVYYGYIDVSPDSGYSDHYVWTSRTLIYDTGNPDNEHYLIDPILTMNANEAGSFEADVPYTNICWDAFVLMLGIIEVEEDGDIIWQGRITQINTDFELNKHIYCEGELSFLNDFVIEVNWDDYEGLSIMAGTWGYYPINYFADLIHCNISSNGKYIYNGIYDRSNSLTGIDAVTEAAGATVVESSTRDTNITAGDTKYKTAWEGFSSDLINGLLSKFEGYAFIVLNREHDSHGYRRVIDLMVVASDAYRDIYGDLLFGKGLEKYTNQKIEFGKNLIDIDVEIGIQDGLITAAYAFGYQTKGWWIFKNTSAISGSYVDLETSSKYGIIQKAFSVDGVDSTEGSLTQAAMDAVTSQNAMEYRTIKLKAIDLYDAGEAPDHLKFMSFTQVISKAHGINQNMLCTGCTIPLDKPDQKEFTYGSTVKRFTKSQNITNEVADKGYKMSRTTMDYVTDS